MERELVLYTNPKSRGRIVRWMLEEVGVPYRTEVVSYGASMKAPDYLALNPMGKVPTLTHGDAVVTETAAICAYLADAFPAARLIPDFPDRAQYYRWFFFAAGPLEAAVSNHAMGLHVPKEKQGMLGYGNYELVLDTLEKAVSTEHFVAGPQFSAADVYVGSHIGWGLQFGTIESRPAFESYWQKVSSRPARKRAEELDDAA